MSFPLFKALDRNPVNGLAAGADSSGHCRVWDAANGASTGEPAPWGTAVEALAWSPDGRWLAAGDRTGSVRLRPFGSEDGGVRPERSFTGHAGAVGSLAWTRCGTRLASGGADGVVRVRDARSCDVLAELTVGEASDGFGKTVRALTWHPDGRHLVTGTHGGRIQIWDTETGRQAAVLDDRGPWPAAMAVTARGDRLMVGGRGGAVRIWELGAAPHATAPVALDGHRDSVLAGAASPDGLLVATGGMDQVVRLWDAATGAPVARCEGLGGWVRSVGFSADGEHVVGIDAGGTAAVWNRTGGRPLSSTRLGGTGWPTGDAPSGAAPGGWRDEAARHPWPSMRCGCGRGARHVPYSFATLVAARTEEEADAVDLADDIESGGMLFEAAVPVASMLVAALREEDLSDPARLAVLDLLLGLVSGESDSSETALDRPFLETECREAVRGGIPVLKRELTREGDPGAVGLVLEILETLDAGQEEEQAG
ncbi:WD40 repeat domain-containing protein [Streptomyces sp. NPDC001478]